MDKYLRLAKGAVETYLKEGRVISSLKKLPKKMRQKAGVFVSIHKKDGSLRGCIGTYLPTTENIAYEIIKNAIASATRDPRFPPITSQELESLTYSVDILSPLKFVTKVNDLDTKKYGLIVSTSDGRRGLLLPDIPGVETPGEQLRICRLKAGIEPDEEITLQIFTVERHKDEQG